MKRTIKKIKVVSLFAGCGGGDLGVVGDFKFLGKNHSKLGFEVVWANEIDPVAVKTYRKNIGDHIVEGDITTIGSSQIPDHDLLIGGFPCQSFSMVGRRRGFNDPRGKLYREMLRVVKDKQPSVFIGENVKGLVSIDNGKAIQKITADFAKAGYDVTYKVLNSSLFGVPQKRERVFIVGIRKDRSTPFFFPEPSAVTVPLKAVMENHEKVDRKYYFSERALEGLRKANKAFNKGRAQDPESPCNTVSTHLAKVSLNGTDPVLLVSPNVYRRLTPKEAAGIQSFPNNFNFEGSDGKKYIQIGNAIPPVLMWYVAKSLKEQVFDDRPLFELDHISDSLKEYDHRTEDVLVPA